MTLGAPISPSDVLNNCVPHADSEQVCEEFSSNRCRYQMSPSEDYRVQENYHGHIRTDVGKDNIERKISRKRPL